MNHQASLFDASNEPERKPEPEDDPTFRQRVYDIALQIPRGKVTTYGAIAAALGHPRAARQVGWAMSGCPADVSEIAHRVLNRNGELSGGWAWGHPDVMKQLLLDEGIEFVAEYQVDLEMFFWDPAEPGQ